ncbi:MAG: HAMP domain-containing histidine kinase [Epsilonproteobacteria bacterium]|nr:HAMP domain-containing histidine kinase [Campylobacterota bacterium]
MNSKKSELLLSNILIVFTITVLVLVAHHLLKPMIPSDMILDIILVSFAILLYLFLGSPLIDNFLKSDKNLKMMVEETLHELNTPIATIEANLSMLKRSIDDKKSLKRLERIKEASSNLTKLYESIEYNIKDNIHEVEKERFDLQTTIDNTINKFEEIKGDITIQHEVPSMIITTDQSGFTTMLDNLISNAIKYNNKNGFVKLYMEDKILHIQDNGIGIDTKNLFIVFEKSYQENPTTQGYGLGLSIVKSFCDKHKIKIKIDTKKDIGTILMLDLQNIL